MARGYERFGTAVVVQASVAIAAAAFSGGTQTEFDKTASGNADGAFSAEIEIDVTAWTADARCEIYQEAKQHDGAGYAFPKLVGSVAVTQVDKYAVIVDGLSEKGLITLKAITTGFTASASFRSIYPADA